MPDFVRLKRLLPTWSRGYALAGALLAVSSGLSVPLYHGAWRYSAAVFFLSTVLASAWWGGFGPGAMAALFTFAVAPRLLVPTFRLSQVNWVSCAELLAISLLISWAAESRRKLRLANEELDKRVRERTAELERANVALQERESLLLRQTEELARSNADLEQFAYIASHDLQEPLRMVAIYAELLARRYRAALDSEGDGFIGTIIEGVRRMETLLRDLLAYSHIIHAEPPAPEPFQASEAVRIAMDRLEVAIRESNAKIEAGPLPELHGDCVAVTQLFQNLLSNALKYRSSGGVEIRISAQQANSEWIFTVEDNGIGIHSDYHETIFEPFKRLHGREYRGSGVGLAICRRIVERHNGRIWVESEPGRGSKFRFTIPGSNGVAVSSAKSLAANERP